MAKNQVFEIQKISRDDLGLIYRQILERVLASEDRNQMKDCVKLYINYVANRRGLTGTYSFEPPRNVIDAEKLANRFPESENKAYVNLEKKHFVFNDLLLTCNNFEDFAFVVQEIEHEFQHMALKNNPYAYSSENPNGIKSEFYNHKHALTTIKEYIENEIKTTQQFSEADITRFKTVAHVLYHFDDDEIYARLVGIEAARQFLGDMQKVAGKQFGKALKEEIKSISQSYLLNEQVQNGIKNGVLRENQAETHMLLFSVLENAMRDNNLVLACAVAETQDIKQLFNPVIFKHLKKFAKKAQSMELDLHLDNSKYARVPKSKTKADYKTFIQSNPTITTSPLNNVAFSNKQDWINEEAKKPPEKIVVAKELPEAPQKKVYGRRFASQEKPDQKFFSNLKQELHSNATLSGDAKGFLERRVRRMQQAEKKPNDTERDLGE